MGYQYTCTYIAFKQLRSVCMVWAQASKDLANICHEQEQEQEQDQLQEQEQEQEQ